MPFDSLVLMKAASVGIAIVVSVSVLWVSRFIDTARNNEFATRIVRRTTSIADDASAYSLLRLSARVKHDAPT